MHGSFSPSEAPKLLKLFLRRNFSLRFFCATLRIASQPARVSTAGLRSTVRCRFRILHALRFGRLHVTENVGGNAARNLPFAHDDKARAIPRQILSLVIGVGPRDYLEL